MDNEWGKLFKSTEKQQKCITGQLNVTFMRSEKAEA